MPEPDRRLVTHMNPDPRRGAGNLILLGASLAAFTLLGTLFGVPLVQYWLAP